jgi:hypothetical protein
VIERALVLDIETALDRDAAMRAQRSGPTAFLRIWLHRVVAATTLGFTLDRDAHGFSDFALDSVLATDPADEPALLDNIEERLAALGETGLLITFNGRAHDLPVLAYRRLRHWRFAPTATARLRGAACERHADVMHLLAGEGPRWPALIDVCAAHGIPVETGVRRRRGERVEPFLARNQCDVLATFLLWCLCAAETEGASTLFDHGWTALADHVLGRFPAVSHLTQFATAPMALIARERAQTG